MSYNNRKRSRSRAKRKPELILETAIGAKTIRLTRNLAGELRLSIQQQGMEPVGFAMKDIRLFLVFLVRALRKANHARDN